MTKEEKDKLIALSDLNREDNIKYISSEAQGIAIALDSDRYAPTFCKLERAYICGRRKSEEQIAELEKSCDETQELLDKQIEATYKLDKENAELKKKCYKKAVKDYCEVENQLTKAKEIIKLLLGDLRNRSYEPVKDLERAEQFLSCTEIPNN